MATFAAMQTERPDDATGDSVILARVHAFMVSLLVFLGFKVLPVETVVDMLDTLTKWLDSAKQFKRDSQGVTAKIWWEAFKLAWKSRSDYNDHSFSAEKAAADATAATVEFGKCFLPAPEEDRDTLNTADFDAMRAELDQADQYRGEICNAIDGIAGDRMFAHPKIIDELRAERDALLASSKHHASEVESLRVARANALLDCAALANALDGVRAAIGQKNLPNVDVAREVTNALAGAIRPLPKPEQIEPGQRWLWQFEEPRYIFKRDVRAQAARHVRGYICAPSPTSNPIQDEQWLYLGTDKV